MALTLKAAVGVTAPPPRPYEHDQGALDNAAAIARAYGLTVSADLLRRGPQVAHADLVDLLVERLPPDGEGPDLVILAHGLPDARPRKIVASYLNARTGGRAHSFALSGQGVGAPFTALRMGLAYAKAGRARRFLLCALDQTTLPHRDPVVDGNGLGDAGALLAFGPGPGRGLAVGDAGQCHDGIAARLAALVTDPGGTLLVLGPWADPSVAGATSTACHRVAPGAHCTGVWLALAEHAERWARDYATVLLHDGDPRSGAHFLAVLRSDGGPAQ
ncbi:hypothetical protein [Actinomadura terrae]|uniref:hypothetical protein n=1 Tax=Actinomadura terrae TaxID=604353 RepID=UPI001FA77E1C|nr:hypothetical protein [Actinomadura terrae]